MPNGTSDGMQDSMDISGMIMSWHGESDKGTQKHA